MSPLAMFYDVVVWFCASSIEKKMFNQLDRTSKHLVMGDQTVTLAAIWAVVNDYPPWKHGVRLSDLSPKRNRQNVPPIERMSSRVCHVPCLWHF